MKQKKLANKKSKKYVLWFSELTIKDVPHVGGKNASLGEMYQKLGSHGVLIPNGYAVSADAYWYFLEYNGIKNKIQEMLKGLDTNKIIDLKNRAKKIRELILKSEFPEDLKKEIILAYKNLAKFYKISELGCDVAVRSSATAEDAADASFAGQQESYLNITGEYALIS